MALSGKNGKSGRTPISSAAHSSEADRPFPSIRRHPVCYYRRRKHQGKSDEHPACQNCSLLDQSVLEGGLRLCRQAGKHVALGLRARLRPRTGRQRLDRAWSFGNGACELRPTQRVRRHRPYGNNRKRTTGLQRAANRAERRRLRGDVHAVETARHDGRPVRR